MKNLGALPILILALTTLSGCGSDKPKEFRELIPAEPPKIDLKSIPEHPLTITVRIDTEDRVYVNKEQVGMVEDTGELTKRLARVFEEKQRLLDSPEGAEIGETERKTFKSKPVDLEVHRSTKYVKVAKIVEVLKAEGCKVNLRIDDVSPP